MAHMRPTRQGCFDHYPVRIGPRGRLVVPAALRRRLGLRPGQVLTFTIDNRDELEIPRLTTAQQTLEALRKRLDQLARKRARARRPS